MQRLKKKKTLNKFYSKLSIHGIHSSICILPPPPPTDGILLSLQNAASAWQKYAASPHPNINTCETSHTCILYPVRVASCGLCMQVRADSTESWVASAGQTVMPDWNYWIMPCNKQCKSNSIRNHEQKKCSDVIIIGSFSYSGNILGSENRLREQLHNQSSSSLL